LAIEKKPFKKYTESNKSDVITIKLNEDERRELEEWKYLILQEKDSTALKQLARIGAKVLHDDKIKLINSIVLNNNRKNKRIGLVTFD